MGLTYQKPHLDAPVVNLVPENSEGAPLEPETRVTCINRGRKALHDKCDGRDYTIPPGYFELPYGIALHFQNRLVIPGTRNPELGVQQSFIGIVTDDWSLDPEWACQPLTDEECERMGLQIEAIDRESLDDPDAKAVHPVKMAGARAGIRGQGLLSKKPQIDTSRQASPGAAEAAEHVFDKPGTTDAQREASEFQAEAEPEPPAPRRRR